MWLAASHCLRARKEEKERASWLRAFPLPACWPPWYKRLCLSLSSQQPWTESSETMNPDKHPLFQLLIWQAWWYPHVILPVINMKNQCQEWRHCLTCQYGSKFWNWLVGRIWKNMHVWSKATREHYKWNAVGDSGRRSEDQKADSNVKRKGHAHEISDENKDSTWDWTRCC